MPKLTDEQIVRAYDILDKFDFFNQRAGRELWCDKPKDIQDTDIENFARDVKFLKDFINRLMADNKRLEYTLLGVMHFVDKWLDGEELEQDEVNRADTMREKTLRMIETAKTDALKEFAESFGIAIDERLSDEIKSQNPHLYLLKTLIKDVLKEMVGEG